MSLANIGGGWVGVSTKTAPSFADYNKLTMDGFASYLSDWPLKLIIMTEPGRALISKAGWLQTHAISISKHTLNTGTRSAFLALGTHHGLNEANKIPFEWHTWHPSEKAAPCGNSDIVLGLDVDGNEKTIYLPLALASGDPLRIHGPAAYGPAYCTSFNGVPPPKVVYSDSHQGISHFSEDGSLDNWTCTAAGSLFRPSETLRLRSFKVKQQDSRVKLPTAVAAFKSLDTSL